MSGLYEKLDLGHIRMITAEYQKHVFSAQHFRVNRNSDSNSFNETLVEIHVSFLLLVIIDEVF